MLILGIGMKQNNKGFTLIEVLAALAVLAIGLTALIISSMEVTRNIAYLQDKTAATWVARNVVAQARLGLIDRSKTQTGNMEMLGERWKWQANFIETEDENTKKIQVSVRSPAGHSVITMTGFLGVGSL